MRKRDGDTEPSPSSIFGKGGINVKQDEQVELISKQVGFIK